MFPDFRESQDGEDGLYRCLILLQLIHNYCSPLQQVCKHERERAIIFVTCISQLKTFRVWYIGIQLLENIYSIVHLRQYSKRCLGTSQQLYYPEMTHHVSLIEQLNPSL